MAKTLSVHLNLRGNRKGVVDVKDVFKNRWKNAVRSAPHDRARLACVSRLDQDREIRLSQLFLFRLGSCSLFAWLAGCVSTIKSCRSQARISAPTGQKLVIQLFHVQATDQNALS
jgi:hypothetical protein